MVWCIYNVLLIVSATSNNNLALQPTTNNLINLVTLPPPPVVSSILLCTPPKLFIIWEDSCCSASRQIVVICFVDKNSGHCVQLGGINLPINFRPRQGAPSNMILIYSTLHSHVPRTVFKNIYKNWPHLARARALNTSFYKGSSRSKPGRRKLVDAFGANKEASSSSASWLEVAYYANCWGNAYRTKVQQVINSSV